MRRRRSNAPRDRCETGAVPAWRLTVPLVLAAGIFLHGHAESHAGAVAGPADAVGEAPAHDAAYWHAVIGNDFTPPDDAPLPALLWELNGYLSSTDPELRDDIAYGILTQWLYGRRIVPVELRRELVAVWRENLSKGIGETGTDSVFLRSFSALMLSVAVALDNEAPWLEEREFDRLLASALAYQRDERDTRGFDRDKG